MRGWPRPTHNLPTSLIDILRFDSAKSIYRLMIPQFARDPKVIAMPNDPTHWRIERQVVAAVFNLEALIITSGHSV